MSVPESTQDESGRCHMRSLRPNSVPSANYPAVAGGFRNVRSPAWEGVLQDERRRALDTQSFPRSGAGGSRSARGRGVRVSGLDGAATVLAPASTGSEQSRVQYCPCVPPAGAVGRFGSGAEPAGPGRRGTTCSALPSPRKGSSWCRSSPVAGPWRWRRSI